MLGKFIPFDQTSKVMVLYQGENEYFLWQPKSQTFHLPLHKN